MLINTSVCEGKHVFTINVKPVNNNFTRTDYYLVHVSFVLDIDRLKDKDNIKINLYRAF